MKYLDDQRRAHDFDVLLGRWKVVNRRKKGICLLPTQARGEAAEWEGIRACHQPMGDRLDRPSHPLRFQAACWDLRARRRDLLSGD